MMVGHSHSRRRHLKNRQNDPLQVPNVSGIDQSSALVVATNGATSVNALALDTAASTLPPQSGIPLAGTYTPVITSTIVGTSLADTPTASTSPSSTPNAVGATNILPLKTVIASCIAAFVGALFFVLIGLGLYRRYMRSLKKSYVSQKGRNTAGEADRQRSHLEPWSKLGDEKRSDAQTKEMDGVAPMEKMFKKPPSVRTAYTNKSDEPMTFEMPLSLAQYHPEFAKQNASKSSEEVTVHRPFLGRAESGPTISWDADTMNENAVTSQHLSATSGGNTTSIAIPTPVATRTLHRWESAEVINPDVEEWASNPFESEAERRKSGSNPFFKGLDYPTLHMRTRSNSMASNRSTKPKDRSSQATSFASDATAMAKPPLAHHIPSFSREDALNNTHAIQSLIRALDVTEQEIQDRLRVSMQPSVLTMDSMYVDAVLASSFPLPPEGGNTGHQQSSS